MVIDILHSYATPIPLLYPASQDETNGLDHASRSSIPPMNDERFAGSHVPQTSLFTGRFTPFGFGVHYSMTSTAGAKPEVSVICLMEAKGTASPSSPWEFNCGLEVDYGSDEKALMVYAALVVDKELQPDKVKRKMSVNDGKLSVQFEAVEARFLRASYSAFVDVLTLATQTIEQFGPGMEL